MTETQRDPQSGTNPNNTNFLLVRGIAFFFLLAVLLGGLYWLCLHHFANVAEWSGTADAPRESLLYGEETYHLAAAVGSPGVSSANFVKGEALGEVKLPLRDAVTYNCPVYEVKTGKGATRRGFLIVTREDGEDYVYYLDGTENPYRPLESDIDIEEEGEAT